MRSPYSSNHGLAREWSEERGRVGGKTVRKWRFWGIDYSRRWYVLEVRDRRRRHLDRSRGDRVLVRVRIEGRGSIDQRDAMLTNLRAIKAQQQSVESSYAEVYEGERTFGEEWFDQLNSYHSSDWSFGTLDRVDLGHAITHIPCQHDLLDLYRNTILDEVAKLWEEMLRRRKKTNDGFEECDFFCFVFCCYLGWCVLSRVGLSHKENSCQYRPLEKSRKREGKRIAKNWKVNLRECTRSFQFLDRLLVWSLILWDWSLLRLIEWNLLEVVHPQLRYSKTQSCEIKDQLSPFPSWSKYALSNDR